MVREAASRNLALLVTCLDSHEKEMAVRAARCSPVCVCLYPGALMRCVCGPDGRGQVRDLMLRLVADEDAKVRHVRHAVPCQAVCC